MSLQKKWFFSKKLICIMVAWIMNVFFYSYGVLLNVLEDDKKTVSVIAIILIEFTVYSIAAARFIQKNDIEKKAIWINSLLYALFMMWTSCYIVYTKVGVLIVNSFVLILTSICFCFIHKRKKSIEIINIVNRALIISIIISALLNFLMFKYYQLDFLYRSEKMYWVLFLITFIWITLFAVWNVSYYCKRIEVLYAIAAVTMGIFYLVILPPMSAPDEECHFAMAYSYSNELLGGKRAIEAVGLRENGNGCMFYKIPARNSDADCIKNTYDFEYVWQYPGYKQYKDIKTQISNFSESEEQFGSYFIGRFTNATSLAYLPSVIGITLARLIGFGGMQMIFCGRLFNYAFFVLLIYWSIKKTPVGKKIFMISALIPMTLELAASYSYDSVLISSTYFFVAYVLYLLYTKAKVEWKDVVVLVSSILLVSSAKVVYSFVIILLCLLPYKKFSSKKAKMWIIVMIILVSVMVVYKGSASGIEGYITVEAENTEYYTIGYMLNHIEETIFTVVNSIIVEGEYYIETLFGRLLGWLEFRISLVITMCILLLCSLGLIETKGTIGINKQQSLIFALIFVMVCATLLAVVTMWTPVNSTIIQGFQGRYLLEVLPILLIAIAGLTKNIYIVNDNSKLLVRGIVVINIMCVITVFNIIMMR